jgi:beta-glucosidase/6-phospho-beta-glucosidase/beta-galactosidase
LKGIQYYHKLIDKLIENGIVPIATMYHFDLPQYLQELGGFLNPIFIEHFKNYADALFKHFGEKVKTWITFNEPYYTCIDGYSTGNMVPMVKASDIGGEYLCTHHTLIAHAKAYRLYKEKYFKQQQGRIGIAPNTRSFIKKDESVTADVEERGMQFLVGLFLNPIFGKTGNYPQIVIDIVGNNSLDEGRNLSRLPLMTEKLQNYIKGTSDFLAVNYYTTRLTDINKDAPNMKPSWEKDFGLNMYVDPTWEKAHSPWLYSVPEGLRNVLVWLKKTYNNPRMLIAENGCSDDGSLNDTFRIKYLRDHMIAVSKAIKIDNCDIEGYSVWSIIDNFEWMRGYL